MLCKSIDRHWLSELGRSRCLEIRQVSGMMGKSKFVSPSSIQEVADNQIDSGDLMECLIQNKHQKEMNEKCAIGVTHFQLVSMAHFSASLSLVCGETVQATVPSFLEAKVFPTAGDHAP